MENEYAVQFVLQEKADLVGIVKVGDLIQALPWRPPTRILPEAQSLIIFEQWPFGKGK